MQSNVLKTERRRPSPSCVICNGTGRVDCHDCSGRGLSLSLPPPPLPFRPLSLSLCYRFMLVSSQLSFRGYSKLFLSSNVTKVNFSFSVAQISLYSLLIFFHGSPELFLCPNVMDDVSFSLWSKSFKFPKFSFHGFPELLLLGRTNFVNLPILPKGEWPKW